MSQTRRPFTNLKALEQRINSVAAQRSRAAYYVEKAAVTARVRQAIAEGADAEAVLFELERESALASSRVMLARFKGKAQTKG